MPHKKKSRPHRDVPERRRLDATKAREFAAFARLVRQEIPALAGCSDAQIRAELEEAIDWLAPNPDVASTPLGHMAQAAMDGDEEARDFFRLHVVQEEQVKAEELAAARESLWAIMRAQRDCGGPP